MAETADAVDIPGNPTTVERVIVLARQASIQFDGSFRFLRDGDYFEIVIGADETARHWRDIPASALDEELGEEDAVPILVEQIEGVVARGEISGIERDGDHIVIGAYTLGSTL